MAVPACCGLCSCYTSSDFRLVLSWYVPCSYGVRRNMRSHSLSESPRWLMKKARYREAFEAFCRLRNTELIAARDLVCFHSAAKTWKLANGKLTNAVLCVCPGDRGAECVRWKSIEHTGMGNHRRSTAAPCHDRQCHYRHQPAILGSQYHGLLFLHHFLRGELLGQRQSSGVHGLWPGHVLVCLACRVHHGHFRP